MRPTKPARRAAHAPIQSLRLLGRAIVLAAVLAPALGGHGNASARVAPRIRVIARVLQQPRAVGLDGAGNVYVLIGDDRHPPQLIRESATGRGQVLLAGGPDLAEPLGQMAVDAGGTVYLADPSRHRVLRIAPGGARTPLGGNLGTPTGVALAANGTLYILDASGNRVLTIAPGGTTPTILYRLEDFHLIAGSAGGGIAVDGGGNVYLALGGDYGVARIAEGTATATTLAKGVRISSGFALGSGFSGMVVDRAGTLYLADADKNRVVRVAAGGTQTSLGSGLNDPDGLALDGAGNLYVADRGNNRLLRLPAGGTQALVGNDLQNPGGLAVDGRGNVLILDSTSSTSSTTVTFATDRLIRLPAGGGVATAVLRGLKAPPAIAGICVDSAGNTYVTDSGHDRVLKLPAAGGAPVAIGGLHEPLDVTVDGAGDVFVTVVTATHGSNEKETIDMAVVRIATDGGRHTVFRLKGIQAILAAFLGIPIVADRAGDLYLAEVRDATHIPMYMLPAGGGVAVALPAFPNAVPVGTDARGGLYVLAAKGKQTTVLRRGSGASTTSTVIDTLPSGGGIAIDAQGNVYTTGDGLVREYLTG